MPSEFDIKLLSAEPHHDIPVKAKIFAQIIIDHTIFLHAIPVDRVGQKKDGHWKLILDCDMWV